MSRFEEWIIRQVASDWEGWISRQKWVEHHRPQYEEGFFFGGGTMVAYLLQEAIITFIYGQFLATNILAISFIEQVLTSQLHMLEVENADQYTLGQTIPKAREMGLITESEETELYALNKRRIPVVHFKDINDDVQLDRRVMNTWELPEEIVEEDAKQALSGMFMILQRFGLGRRMRPNLHPANHPEQSTLKEFLH